MTADRLSCVILLAAVGGLALPRALSAERVAAATSAATRNRVVLIKPGTRLRFGRIECLARVTTYSYLVCCGQDGKDEVAVSDKSVVVVRARDGKVIYDTP